MSEKTFVSVFRSSKKPGTYLFVRRGQVWEDLPDSLKGIFGKPVHSMDLVLTNERKLARTDGRQVLQAIEDKGFFLQMSDEQSGYVVDFRRKPEQQKGESDG
ncbi:YcgL domain-containing protein [Marinobacter halotolerans]|uniref:YcgL domain-containing protein n=1 Tax=Marinobacter halotolerans TaxID=1569211 RepID=UPI0012472B7E|nr:YcgL domain-containing protein [Marinobacter halotolerans]